MKNTILIVDDSKELRRVLSLYLKTAGYHTLEAVDGIDALEIAKYNKIDLMIVDVMMPRLDGYKLVELVRMDNNIPVLFLSAKDEVEDKIKGLTIGGDDYMVKPYDPMEVIARIEALLRRVVKEDSNIKIVRDIKLDTHKKRVYKNNEILELTSKEYKILSLLISNPDRIFSKGEIFSYVWEDDFLTDDNTIMVHISNLRDKIEHDPRNPRFIKTIRGLGYTFVKGDNIE